MKSDHRSVTRAARTAASAVAAALLLAACGAGGHEKTGGGSQHGDHAGSEKGSGSGNAADVAFAQGMIPHHRQALEMSELTPSRASSPEVKSLAAAIRGAQEPEIETLSGWLESWDEKVPPKSSSGHSEHGEHSGHAMPGMMTAEDMEQLKKASGKEFDRKFLKLMIEHHEGAVEMARTEVDKGSYGKAKSMARDIERSQKGEIAQMRKMLKQ
ncbi:lipoprotein [Streptomyces daqingensis]|uniref:Lipoprotein n=1 Tax=Streptomyces daqingensis TaxID=1472640 RepID=A0ABQ2MEX4_9ACTN|nr:DUF305 domain-containing protein [Streptomyces daqingensis]GGO50863.1 lipoprotein [Streptomyces daqingensis]